MLVENHLRNGWTVGASIDTLHSMKGQFSAGFYLKAQRRFGGRYIARQRNRVLASAKTLKDLLKVMKVRKIPHEGEVSIGYVPSANSLHVYCIR